MSGSDNSVVLVHGLNDTSIKMLTIAQRIQCKGRQVYSIDLIPSDGTASLAVLAHQLAEFIDRHIPNPHKFDLVGFSMGGLVSRYYMQRLGGIKRVEHYVTIAAPHEGTIAAYFTQLSGCLEMRPDSLFLQDLQRDVQTLNQVKFTSIWTPFDLMILPSWSSQIRGARDVKIPVAVHPWMVTDERAIQAVLEGIGSSHDRCL